MMAALRSFPSVDDQLLYLKRHSLDKQRLETLVDHNRLIEAARLTLAVTAPDSNKRKKTAWHQHGPDIAYANAAEVDDSGNLSR